VPRCFYYSELFSGAPPPEHVLPAAINGDLVTDRVCGPCNHRARVEVDQPWLDDYLVKESRVRLRIPNRRGDPPRHMSIPLGPPGNPPAAIVHLDGVSGSTMIKRIPKDESKGAWITMSGYSKEDLAQKIERLKRDHPNFVVVEVGGECRSSGGPAA
jgi:hypothetical protein